MPRKKIAAGIGAVGSAPARFFHPSKDIRAKWPNDHSKKRLSGVIVLGQGQLMINRKLQKTYEVRIPELDNSVVYHIVRRNIRLDVACPDPSNVFPEEVAAAAPAPRPPGERGSHQNAQRNVGRGATADELNELRQQGITIDESMNSWLNKFCPGFMCVPRKPHPLGKEYHSIADGDQGQRTLSLNSGGNWPKACSNGLRHA